MRHRRMSFDDMFIFQLAKRQHAYLKTTQQEREFIFLIYLRVKVQLNICIAAFQLGVFK